MIASPPVPQELKWLVDAAPETLAWLAALATAPWMTDDLAFELLVHFVDVPGNIARNFVENLQISDFVTKGHGEWHLHENLRRYLLAATIERAHALRIHRFLLDRARAANATPQKGDPAYLHNGLGEAYHATELAAAEGLALYASLASLEFTSKQWMLGRLAEEQQQRGAIPPDAFEPSYLRGLSLYSEGRMAEAEKLLRFVTMNEQIRPEVAIACYIVGRSPSLWEQNAADAERLLLKSAAIFDRVNEPESAARARNALTFEQDTRSIHELFRVNEGHEELASIPRAVPPLSSPAHVRDDDQDAGTRLSDRAEPDRMNTKVQFDALMHEYDALQAELLRRVLLRDRLMYLTLVSIGGLAVLALSSIQQDIKTFEVFLLIPWATALLGARYLQHDTSVTTIAQYIEGTLYSRIMRSASAPKELSRERFRSAKSPERSLLRTTIEMATFVCGGIAALIAYWIMAKPGAVGLVAIFGDALLLGIVAQQIIVNARTVSTGKG